jgi:hypothetical protein
LGAFLTRRVETFRVLVKADRALPMEILARDGARLGRMTEISGDDSLTFGARGRDAAATSWTRRVASVFAGDAIDGATASALRRDLDESWMRTALVALIRLSAGTALVGAAVWLGWSALGLRGAKDFAEIVALTYFLMIGVYEHAGGSKVFARYFGADRDPSTGPLWRRVIGFVRDSWKESVRSHDTAVTVSLDSASGRRELGDIARGVGAHAFAGNGVGRQLALLAPWLLGAAAAGALALLLAPPAGLAALAAALPFSGLSAVGALGAAGLASALLASPLAALLARPGIAVRSHRGRNPAWTVLAGAGILLCGLIVAAAAAHLLWTAASLASVLAAIVIVLDPFGNFAKSYDATLKSRPLPIAGLAFLTVTLGGAAIAFAGLSASAFVGVMTLVGLFAVLAVDLGSSLVHALDPGVAYLKTPRSTPALSQR